MNRRRAAGLVAALVAAGLAGCGGDDGGTYRLSATFERTVGLYPSGDVHVMGIAVGHVEDIVIDGTTVRVEMRIRDDVPLPADVQATIGQTQLIGERNVVLFPPWDAARTAAGEERAADGDVIPLARTQVPVEPDEGLEAFNELAQSLDAEVVGGFVEDAAGVLDGRGESIGAAIDQTAALGTTLAEVDQQLLAAAEDLQVLAGGLRDREAQLAELVDHFSEATAVLAAERESIAELLRSLVALTDEGQDLLDLYGEQLPGDVATATALTSILEQNAASIDQLLSTFPELAEGIAEAYQPEIEGFYLRANITPTVQALLDVFTDLGLLPDLEVL